MPGFGGGGPWGGSGVGPAWRGGPGPDHPGWAPFVWGLLPALVFGGLIALIVLLLIRTTRERGELARDDYLRIAADLGHGTGDGGGDGAAGTSAAPETP